eukprot:COSAG02_NODE_69_length_42323_cov_23.507850_28_plen_289_part_00
MEPQPLRRLQNLARDLVGVAPSSETSHTPATQKKEWSIAIHGGAGVMVEPGSEQEKEYHVTLESSLRAGAAILEAGGSSEEAVEAAVEVMEDSPLFNCAYGSSVTMKGQVEMDAAMMSGNGKHTRAGAVSSATRVRNPIKVARKVLEDNRFVLLTADGADDFAEKAGLAMEGPDYFIADWRWNLHVEHMPAELAAQTQQQQQQRQARMQAQQVPVLTAAKSAGDAGSHPRRELRFGTVGCVALDRSGNLCAGAIHQRLFRYHLGDAADLLLLTGTSTGGLNNKEYLLG